MATVPYVAKRTQDGQLDVVDIPALCVPKCTKCGELLFTESVNEQIDAAFRAQSRVGVPVK